MKNMDAAHGTRRQLGRLLVEKGVLSEAQLELALAEQQRERRPLGEVAVSLGLASGAAVGNALAEQHGGPLRTEYGFAAGPMRTTCGPTVNVSVDPAVAATGLPPQEEKPPAEALVEADPPPLLAVAPLKEPKARHDVPMPLRPPAPVSAPPAEPVQRSPIDAAAEVPADAAPLAPDAGLGRADELASPSSDAVTAPPPDDTSHHPRTPDSVIVELRAALEEQATVLASTQAELAEAAADISRAAHEREELERAVENQVAELREQAAMLARTEAELAEAKVELARAGRERDEEQREATDAPKAMEDAAADERYLLFVPGSGGYAMVEHSGPAPTAGSRVDVVDADGVATPFVVMKVGRSPLPSFGGRCAFLACA